MLRYALGAFMRLSTRSAPCTTSRGVPDEATQQQWRAELVERGAQVASILDRQSGS